MANNKGLKTNLQGLNCLLRQICQDIKLHMILQEIQGGNTVILHVSAGQSVWLAAYNTGNTKVDGRPDYRFSTFSGVLLYE